MKLVVPSSSEAEGIMVVASSRGRGGGRNEKLFNSYRNLTLQDDSIGYTTILVNLKALNCITKVEVGKYKK